MQHDRTRQPKTFARRQGAQVARRRCALVATALAAAITGWCPVGAGADEGWRPPAPDPAVALEIVTHNIFLADRSRPAAPAPKPVAPPAAPAPVPAPPDPDRELVLVGVAIHDGRPCAFIENRGTGEMLRVQRPGAFGRGEIVRIDLDGLTYRVGDDERRVTLRHTLAGGNPGASVAEAPAVGASTAGDETTVDAKVADLIEQMRRRRLNEVAPNQEK